MTDIRLQSLREIARFFGICSCLTSTALWIVSLFLNPYGTNGRTAGSYVIVALMVGFAGIGAYLSWAARPVGMDVVFIFSFVPIGFYTLLTPSFFKFIGVANLLFLGAALLLHAAASIEKRHRRRSA